MSSLAKCLGGEIGRHRRLKISRRKVYRFESNLRHQNRSRMSTTRGSENLIIDNMLQIINILKIKPFDSGKISKSL